MEPVKLNPSFSSILSRIRHTLCRSTVLVLFLRNSSQLVTRNVLPGRHPEQNKNDKLETTIQWLIYTDCIRKRFLFVSVMVLLWELELESRETVQP